MPQFEHQRHKIRSSASASSELILACAPMRSNINISGIARSASASGIKRLILTGNAKLINKIARDGADALSVEVHRSLEPVLRGFREAGFRLVGLEQTTNSQDLNHYAFHPKSVLVIGNERLGLTDEILALLDDVIEIPVYGLPHSFNASSATAMALYEYRRQLSAGLRPE
ncbi:MAG: tRNA G18 (ribose-2'-O)-methylase SpoU [Verrucomicrobiales bacterium]|jgi:tRNA G18 (ribose-2'-O)-methylase SpoU